MPDEVMRLPLPKQIIKLTGQNVTFAQMASNDFSDFPKYQKFMATLKQRGVSVKEAARRCANVPFFRPPYYPPTPEQPKPVPPPRKSLFGWLDGLLTTLMGHDTK